jgi:uncharacterized OB-fold protein
VLGIIIILICLAILAAINILCFFKNGKNYLNLVAAGFLILAIIINCYSGVKKVNSANTEITKEIEKNIEEKESKLEILGVNMECPKCGRTLWSDDKFCSDCGYEKDISDFGKNARDYIIYNCPKCEKLTSSRRNFCSDCGENLTEFNKMIDEAVSSR